MKLNLLCSRFNLKKVVRSPTRGTNVLDQIITNMLELYNEVAHLPPIGRSDHQCLLYHPKAKENIKPCSRKVRLMKPNKLISLGVKLDHKDWNPVFNAQDIDEKVDKFTTIVTQLLDDTLPETTIRTHVSDKPWMTSFIKRKIKARQRAFSSGDVIKYKELCDKIKTLIKKAKKEYYHSKVGSQRNYNPARWYKDIFQLAGFEITSTINSIKNPQKTKDMWTCFSNAIPEPAPLVMDSVNIERVSSYKLLGVWHQDNLKWNRHVEEMVKKANKRIFSLRECRTAKLPREVGLTCYLTKIRSVLEYGAAIWGGLPEYLANEIESTQNRCQKILGIPRDNLTSLRERRDNIAMEELKRIHTDATHPCHKFIPLPASHTHDLRRNSSISYPISHTKRHEQSLIPRAIALLNKHDSN